jgi:hypothetical protein
MGCVPGFFARVGMLVVWIWTPLVTRAYHGAWLWPLLGIVFLPVTALTYAVVFAIAGGVDGRAWWWIVLAVLCDLALHSTTPQARRRVRRAPVENAGTVA